MTITLRRFKLSSFTRVLIAPHQGSFGYHNWSLITVREPLGTQRLGHGINHDPILARELKPPIPFSFVLFS